MFLFKGKGERNWRGGLSISMTSNALNGGCKVKGKLSRTLMLGRNMSCQHWRLTKLSVAESVLISSNTLTSSSLALKFVVSLVKTHAADIAIIGFLKYFSCLHLRAYILPLRGRFCAEARGALGVSTRVCLIRASLSVGDGLSYWLVQRWSWWSEDTCHSPFPVLP
jgi:hypothetical protein